MSNGRGKWRWRTRVACCCTLVCGVANANAQRIDALGVGTTIRVGPNTGAPNELINRDVRSDRLAQTVALYPDALEQTRAFANISPPQPLTAEQSLGQAWKRGSIVGGIVGIVIGGAAIAIAANADRHETCECLRKRAVIAYLLTPPFAAGTAALGGWISAHTREKWEAVRVPDR